MNIGETTVASFITSTVSRETTEFDSFQSSAAQRPRQTQIIDFRMNGYLVLFLVLHDYFGLVGVPIGLASRQL